MSASDTSTPGPRPNDRPVERLLFVADAAVADVKELPPAARALIDSAAEVYVITPTLPGRIAWLADLRSSEHANWQERGLGKHVTERFGLPLTTYTVDRRGHVSNASHARRLQ